MTFHASTESTIHSSMHNISVSCLHQSSGYGFQRRTFQYLLVPDLFPCLRHSRLIHTQLLLSQEYSFHTWPQYATREGCLFTTHSCQINRPLKTSWDEEHRTHHSSSLLPSGHAQNTVSPMRSNHCLAMAVVSWLIIQQRLVVWLLT
jgi:hypothetical protein